MDESRVGKPLHFALDEHDKFNIQGMITKVNKVGILSKVFKLAKLCFMINVSHLVNNVF